MGDSLLTLSNPTSCFWASGGVRVLELAMMRDLWMMNGIAGTLSGET